VTRGPQYIETAFGYFFRNQDSCHDSIMITGEGPKTRMELKIKATCGRMSLLSAGESDN
jgi:hypothetical protein